MNVHYRQTYYVGGKVLRTFCLDGDGKSRYLVVLWLEFFYCVDIKRSVWDWIYIYMFSSNHIVYGELFEMYV